MRALTKRDVLRRYFGYGEFRPGQEKLIDAILSGRDCLGIMPTGGVSADNAEEWFKAGAVALGAGSFLTAGAKSGDFEQVERTCRAFVEKVAKIRGGAR